MCILLLTIFLTSPLPPAYGQMDSVFLSIEIASDEDIRKTRAGYPDVPDLGEGKEPLPGWVRFCQGETKFDFFASQCPVGVWWKPGYKYMDKDWDCVCTRGAWRTSSSWCSGEDAQRFTMGDLTCFTPEGTLEGVSNLNDQFNIYKASSPALLTSYKSGMVLLEGDFSTPWLVDSARVEKDPGIVIYNPNTDWTVWDEGWELSPRLCLRVPELGQVSSLEGIFIYNVSMLFDTASKNQLLKLIFMKGCSTYNAQNGLWFEVAAESLDDKNMILAPYLNETASEKCKLCMSTPSPKAPEADPDGNLITTTEDCSLSDFKNETVLKMEINLQSERMGQYWANRLLRGQPDYLKDNLQEVDILIKAAIMAYGTCDMNYIPKHFYQYFLIMFRQLMSESFKKYAPMGPITPDYYELINSALDKCFARTKPIKFGIEKSCPAKYVSFEDIVDGKAQTVPIVDESIGKKFRVSMKQDYLLDFVWKLKEFLHYNCFEEFEQDSILHDIIQNQIEALFTEDILLRWGNPANSFAMYDGIFKMHMDLSVTMYNFDSCVMAVHKKSKYSVWLRRPLEQPNRQRRSVDRIPLLPSLQEQLYEEIESRRTRIKRGTPSFSGEEPEYSASGEVLSGSGLMDNKGVDKNDLIPNAIFKLFNNTAACVGDTRYLVNSAALTTSQCW